VEDVRTVIADRQSGRAGFSFDGTPPLLRVPGADIWRLLRLDRPPRTVDEGAPADDLPGPLPPNGISIQLVELAPRGDHWPEDGGWRQVDTLDIHVVVSGALLLGLDGGAELRLEPGDTLVQRGTRHRMMAADNRPARFLGAHLMPGSGNPINLDIRPASDGDVGVRRVVTGVDADGRSTAIHDGKPAFVFRPGNSVLTDIWETGGPLVDVGQGGDPAGPWQVHPVGEGGVKVGMVDLPAGDYTAAANWHATDTIDVDVVLSGYVQLHLPDDQVRTLGPGDVVIQRGTLHRWQPVGGEGMRMATLMVSVAPDGGNRG
jgi:quercetin dioxygenase-like cupin family protein